MFDFTQLFFIFTSLYLWYWWRRVFREKADQNSATSIIYFWVMAGILQYLVIVNKSCVHDEGLDLCPNSFLILKYGISIFLLFGLQNGQRRGCSALHQRWPWLTVPMRSGHVHWGVQESGSNPRAPMEILMMSSTGALTAAQHLRQLKYHR